jgi:riboflavin biosynthesis pyrimidine reductase
MLSAQCVDEICLTIAPRFVAGAAARIVTGTEPLDSSWDLAHIAHDDGFVFLRYLRSHTT